MADGQIAAANHIAAFACRVSKRSFSEKPVGGARPTAVLAEAGVQPSKSRGQNFLTQKAIAERIVAAASIEPGDLVIEIGPGLGILSGLIAAQQPGRLVMIEADRRLAAALCERFAREPRLEVVAEDALKTDFGSIANRSGPDCAVKVIGNLPFNIASALLRRLCEVHSRGAPPVSRMVLMFQQEVAQRIYAGPGDPAYGALSVFTSLYWHASRNFVVSAGSFYPRPKVDAEVVVFAPRTPRLFHQAEERSVIETVRASFSAPRKTIRNALMHSLKLDAAQAVAALNRAGIDPGVRAESLETVSFVRLAHELGPVLARRCIDA